MIKGGTKTEALYRGIMLDSSSSLKDFSTDRKKYYKKYVKGLDVEEDNKAANLGRIVKTLLLEPDEFDNKFYLSAGVNTPTGLMLEFVNALYDLAMASKDEKGIIARDFLDLAEEAHTISGFKISVEAVIKKFDGSDAEFYYRELCLVKEKNLTVVTTNEVTFAQRIVDELKINTISQSIIGRNSDIQYTVLNQFQIEGYKIDGLLMKSMIDKIIVDHIKKVIDIYDLKCTWNVEDFIEKYYLYRRSYIQAYVYYKAILSLTEDVDHKWFGYTVNPPVFIVCDSTNYYNTLLFTTTHAHLEQAYNGFTRKGKTYPGVKDIIAGLQWAVETNSWNISKEAYFNDGIVLIDNL